MADLKTQLQDIFRQNALRGKELKAALREIVRENWPGMPPWTTLDAPLIEEVQKATVGSGAVLTFEEGGVRKVVLAEAGGHYKKTGDEPAAYMIPGGFINLSHTPGSALVAASDAPESPQTGVAREVEEELKKPDGSPLLAVDPARLKPMNAKTLGFSGGEIRLVMGFALELEEDEIRAVADHAGKCAADPAYRAATAAQSANHESGKPEVGSVAIFALKDVAEGRCNLLHKDQQSLFEAVRDHFDRPARPRTAPTRAYQDKVKTLDELRDMAVAWRAQGDGDIGVTSGAFDIIHPGHISFLEDASRLCGRLIAIVASDRTVREQKGDGKPYISELKRAQTIAALDTVDAVIVSDEPFHETILAAIRPDVMFKGDDYKGKQIMGAGLAGRVVLIPCAEKDFYSSSAFAKKIREGSPDSPPPWKPGG